MCPGGGTLSITSVQWKTGEKGERTFYKDNIDYRGLVRDSTIDLFMCEERCCFLFVRDVQGLPLIAGPLGWAYLEI